MLWVDVSLPFSGDHGIVEPGFVVALGWAWRLPRCCRRCGTSLMCSRVRRVRLCMPCSLGRQRPKQDCRQGNVMVRVGPHPVNSPADVVHEIPSAMGSPDRAVALRVIRSGQPLFGVSE